MEEGREEGEFPLDLYHCQKELGRGASAVVSLYSLDVDSVSYFELNRRFRAYFDMKEVSFVLQKKLAVKKIIIMSQDDGQEKVRREEYALKVLKHPNIVELYGRLLQPVDPFVMEKLVMEACHGSLRNLLEARGDNRDGLQEWETLWLVVQILLGVQFLHSKDFMHRDLKPENILLKHFMKDQVEDWEKANVGWFCVKIGDFGLSRRVKASTEPRITMSKVGTKGYLAPEVTGEDDSKYHKRADIFSIGVITFEIHNGTMPTADDFCDQEDEPGGGAIQSILFHTLRKEQGDRFSAKGLLEMESLQTAVLKHQLPLTLTTDIKVKKCLQTQRMGGNSCGGHEQARRNHNTLSGQEGMVLISRPLSEHDEEEGNNSDCSQDSDKTIKAVVAVRRQQKYHANEILDAEDIVSDTESRDPDQGEDSDSNDDRDDDEDPVSKEVNASTREKQPRSISGEGSTKKHDVHASLSHIQSHTASRQELEESKHQRVCEVEPYLQQPALNPRLARDTNPRSETPSGGDRTTFHRHFRNSKNIQAELDMTDKLPHTHMTPKPFSRSQQDVCSPKTKRPDGTDGKYLEYLVPTKTKIGSNTNATLLPLSDLPPVSAATLVANILKGNQHGSASQRPTAGQREEYYVMGSLVDCDNTPGDSQYQSRTMTQAASCTRENVEPSLHTPRFTYNNQSTSQNFSVRGSINDLQDLGLPSVLTNQPNGPNSTIDIDRIEASTYIASTRDRVRVQLGRSTSNSPTGMDSRMMGSAGRTNWSFGPSTVQSVNEEDSRYEPVTPGSRHPATTSSHARMGTLHMSEMDDGNSRSKSLLNVRSSNQTYRTNALVPLRTLTDRNSPVTTPSSIRLDPVYSRTYSSTIKNQPRSPTYDPTRSRSDCNRNVEMSKSERYSRRDRYETTASTGVTENEAESPRSRDDSPTSGRLPIPRSHSAEEIRRMSATQSFGGVRRKKSNTKSEKYESKIASEKKPSVIRQMVTPKRKIERSSDEGVRFPSVVSLRSMFDN